MRRLEAGPPPPGNAPVLIVGGGPVGLATALELAHHGVASIVVETRPAVSWLRPRAKTTSARTMEHFRRWGIAAAVREKAPLPQSWSHEAVFCTTLLGPEVTRFDRCFGLDLFEDDLVAEGGQQVPQPVIEQVMREALAASPSAHLASGWTVTSVEQYGDGVVAGVSDGAGGTREIRASYVVGCDGARSVVRDAIGAKYHGSDDGRPNFNMVFRAPGLGALIPHGDAVHYWVLNPERPGVIGKMDLADMWWCIAVGVDAERGAADPVGLVRALIGDQRATVPIEIVATDPWRARMQLADSFGQGRAFLAGDAAHLNPPWGGHGFNTGIGDAVNIGWKLAAVLRGWAPPSLLASYEAERRPVAAETIAVAAQNMATLAPELADPGLTGSAQQFQAVRPAVAAAVQLAKDGEFHSLPLVLGTSYAGSAIVAAGGGAQNTGSGAYRPSAAPGNRLPHRWLGPGRSLFDLLGPEYSLLGDLAAPAAAPIVAAAGRLGIPLTAIELPAAASWFDAPLVRVRPDQHVAWRGGDLDESGAVQLLLCVIGHFTRRPEAQ
jgi:2-polyprenyl-6-methoxyphenol hydroxylase-like FAD-dependent oxidoreductase